jgi:hypothetical protein
MISHNQLSHSDLEQSAAVTAVLEGITEVEPLRLFKPEGHQAYKGLETYLATPLEAPSLQDPDTDELIVKLLQISNDPSAHHMIHGHVLGAASGKPVLTLGSFPESDRLDRKQRKKIIAGDFSPLADIYTATIYDVLKEHDREGKRALGRISLVGTSLGASALPAVAEKLKRNFDITAIGAQSPANIDECHPLREGQRLQKTPEDAYAEALLDTPLEKYYGIALGVKLDGLTREQKIKEIKDAQKSRATANFKHNPLLFAAAGRGLAKGTFARDMIASDIFGEAPLVIGYGGKDALLPAEARERLWGSLNLAHSAVRLTRKDSAARLAEVNFTSYAHDTWDHPRALAAFTLAL